MSKTAHAPSRQVRRATARMQSPHPKRRLRSVLLVGLLVAAAVFAVVLAATQREAAPPVTGNVEVTGASLPQHGEGQDTPIGLAAPAVTGHDFDGSPVVIENDGRPKAILFLAHWCNFCQQEVPVVQEWIDQTGGNPDVDLYSVATGINPRMPNYPPDRWLEREGWTVPVVVDDVDSTAGAAYGLTAYPYWVFVNADGTVAGRLSGQLPVQRLEQILESL